MKHKHGRRASSPARAEAPPPPFVPTEIKSEADGVQTRVAAFSSFSVAVDQIVFCAAAEMHWMNSVFFVAALAAVEDLPDEVRKAVVRQMSTALPEAGAYSLPEAAYQLLLVALAAIPLKLLAYSLTVYTVVQVVAQARLTDQHAHQAAWLGAAVDMGIFGALLGLSFMTDEADLARLLHVYATLNLTCGILRAVYFLCMPGATRSRSLRPATPSEYDEYFAETPPAATEFQGAVRVCQFYAGQKGHALHHRVCELLSGGTAFASTADRWFTQLLVNEFAESEQAILQVHAVRTRDGRVWARLFVVLLTLLYQRSRLFYLHHGDQAGHGLPRTLSSSSASTRWPSRCGHVAPMATLRRCCGW